MSLIPIVNPNRFYDNKEIDLVSLLPNSMKGTEVQTFLQLFEKYLNEIYEGATKYIEPENLESILYTHETIWTDGYQYVTGPYGGFLDSFKAGDFIKRNNETKFYKIEEVVDNSTLKLTELYLRELAPAYLKSAYWDEFTEKEITDFWKPSTLTSAAPEGMDGKVAQNYTIDPTENRIFCNTSAIPISILATKIYGDYQFEFSFHRSSDDTYRNNKFGFDLTPANVEFTGAYKCYYENGLLYLTVYDGNSYVVSGYIEMDPDEDDWVVNVTKNRDTGKIKFKVSSLKNKAGTIPVAFTSAVGFFNRFEYEMTVLPIDGFDNYTKFRMYNGEQQGWNYVYFEADLGFPGEADGVDATSSIREISERFQIYGTPFGRAYQGDGGESIYQFYFNSGNLRIRDLDIPLNFSATDFRSSINHISILEKIRRLTELHDPDLIDTQYIEYFARYLGYSVNITRDNIGIFLRDTEPSWDSLTDEQKQDLQDKYLRFVVSNLPTWYKIKTTDNALATMLYSFGLVTEISHYFCTNYGDPSTWVTEISGTALGLTDKHYQTPHFSVVIDIDIDKNVLTFLSDPVKMKTIIDSIMSVKPINTVFKSLVAYFKRDYDIGVRALAYSNQYVYIR